MGGRFVTLKFFHVQILMPHPLTRIFVLTVLCAVAQNLGPSAKSYAASPNMVRIHTWKGDKHFGPLIDESDDEVSLFDIAKATTVNLDKKLIKTKVGDIDETRAASYVPFASYAAWKLGKILKAGRLEATIVHNSEKGVFVNRGSEDGVETNRRCVLLGDAETITDPTTDEVLGVIREQLGDAIPLTVVSERLSKLNFPEPADDDDRKLTAAYTVKRQVEIEQKPRRIVLAPPRWKATADADSLTDDANFLHAHLIAELVRYGFTVVSKKQTELMRQSIADDRQIDVREVPDIEIAKGAKADVLISVDMLAKGITCQVQLQVTDLKTDEYLGIVSGSTRRKQQKEESARSIAFAQGINAGRQLGIRLNYQIVSMFSLAQHIVFNDDGSIRIIRWGDRPMTAEQFDLLCRLKSLRSFECGGTGLRDSHISKMKDLRNMYHLGIWGTQVTDESCQTISEYFPNLAFLNLGWTKALTTRGVTHLLENRELNRLTASSSNLNDEGLAVIAASENIRQIIADGCRISDIGLEAIHSRSNLTKLDIRNTRVTADGVQKLRAALPNCTVVSDF